MFDHAMYDSLYMYMVVTNNSCTYLFVYYYSYLYSLLTVSVSPYISSSRCYILMPSCWIYLLISENVHSFSSENCTLNLCLIISFLFFSRYVINKIFCCSQIHLLFTCIDVSLILTSFFRENHRLNVVLFYFQIIWVRLLYIYCVVSFVLQ